MAIFKSKEKKEEKTVTKTENKVSAPVKPAKKTSKATKDSKVYKKRATRREDSKSLFSENLEAVLIRPRITEKATISAENSVYVFDVMVKATKSDVSKAIEHFYKTKPVKVNLVKIPAKVRVSRAKRTKGVKSGGKKAYVFLKKGEKIEII